ncbi:conserved hypothetical protein [Candidatus Nitrosotenuis uzonensis]|uniref:Uncharacterized protein n=2 Tax=Candidatus Nitrosotenuis uzonensis TaxID=1407055 RepID=V6AU98_9ARCH|nr:conserved hypothetical protein [Candidatus Nitrosotenuis uzonensis]
MKMSEIEDSFDEYKERLSGMLENKIDVDLAMKIMYLERKLPDVEPKVELDIRVSSESNTLSFLHKINQKFGFQTSARHNHLTAVGRINMDKLAKLASNQEIEWITGSATPASY